jgi:hypothetical protein
VEQRKKPQPTFCVSEALALLRYYISGLFFLTSRISRVALLEASGTLAKKQDFLDLVSNYGAQRVRFKAKVYRDRKGSNPTINLNLNLKGYRSWGIATHGAAVCMQPAPTIPSTTSTITCISNAPEKGNLAFVAAPQLAVEGTHTYVLYRKYLKRYRL